MNSILMVLLLTNHFNAMPGSLTMNWIRVVPVDEQDETLLSGNMTFGAFGGPIIKWTELNDEFGVLVGGRGAFVLNHFLGIGGGGYGLVNDVTVITNNPTNQWFMDFGYGGVILECILGSRKLIHLSFNTLIGGGSVSYHRNWYEYTDPDFFFVMEPELDIELNVSRYLRIGVGGSYRWINGIQYSELSNRSMSGPAAVLTFKFGSF
jgi:hypothetical protein